MEEGKLRSRNCGTEGGQSCDRREQSMLKFSAVPLITLAFINASQKISCKNS